MATPSHLLVRSPPFVRAFTFVWESWRALDARFFRAALTYAVVLGLVLGGSQAIQAIGSPMQITWWRGFVSEFLDTIVATMALVLCIAVAARVKPTRVPRWVPYILAACGAFVVDFALGWVVKTPVIFALIEDPAKWPGLTMPAFQGIWTHAPRMLTFFCLASLGFMFAREAQSRADALRHVQLERAKLARRAFESRLQAMQARVEPQFLFDTLAHVEALYETDANAAERMLDDLIVFLRKALPSLEDSTSTVDAELSLARAWLSITKIRLGGRLQFAVSAPDDASNIRMPPMILLPLLERAVEPMARSDLPTLVELSARVGDGRVRISVAETHGSASDRRTQTLAQIRERLHSLYGQHAAVEVLDDEAVWRTTMEIPYERSDRDHR
jgi:hypothetical protein